MAKSGIASRWEVLSGENNWKGLLHPKLDNDLRRYIIHYGQMAGSVSDVYKDNSDGELPEEEYFNKACLVKGNDYKYKVVRYFNAGSGIVSRTWFGFVAVATDEGKVALGRRDILIVWRGTRGISEWFNNANIKTESASALFWPHTEAKAHSGFLSLYISAREEVLQGLRDVMNRYRDERKISITVAGFSLGGALATLNAMDIVANVVHAKILCTAFTYGSPRVGTVGLKQEFDKLASRGLLRLLRIKNTNDMVTITPPLISYQDVGTELTISSNLSNYFKESSIGREYKEEDVPNDGELNELFGDSTDKGLLVDVVADKFSAHNMDVYLHLISLDKDGSVLKDIDHDIALVNKYLDLLKAEYNIPPRWWDGENRAKMVQLDDNGHWEVDKSRDVNTGSVSSQGSRKRALLVGCNYTRTKFRLRGCINDVNAVKDLIVDDYDFKKENVKVLTDDDEQSSPDLPTHDNIMQELDYMVTEAKAGDVLLFHFSGHGTLIPSLKPGQPYTEDEAIVPCDLNLITDMDLKHLIQKLEPGTSFTMISDSCHSGGLIDKDEEQIGPHTQRDISFPKPDYHCKERFLSVGSIISSLESAYNYANNAVTSLTGSSIMENVGNVVTSLTGSSIMEHVGQALTNIFKKELSIRFRSIDHQRSLNLRSLNEDEGILLSGCQTNETSADVSGKEPHGAFTNALLGVLKKHREKQGALPLTNKELVMEVRSVLQEQGFYQHPCLYCSDENANKIFLGGWSN